MGAPRIRLYIDDEGATEDQLKGIQDRLNNAKPVMVKILKHMNVAQRAQFGSEGGRGDRKWDKDTEAWINRKRAKGWGTDTEVRRGDLRTSLELGGGGEFGNEIRRVTKTSAVYGTSLFYAQFQGHKRRLLYMTGADMNVYGTMMIDWILSGNL